MAGPGFQHAQLIKCRLCAAFKKLLLDLKDVVQQHRPGHELIPPPSMPTLEIHGRRVAYAAAGLDNSELTPPVILLHGFGGFFMDWPRVMAPLARATRVYAIDLPGWGFSEPNPNARALEDEVKVIGQFIQKLGLKNPILCGLSYGGGVAWAAAALHLPRVSRVVLLNPMPPHPLRYMHSPLYRSIFFLNSIAVTNKWGHRFLNKSQYKLICRENLLNYRLLESFYLDLAYLVIKQPKIPRILGMHAQGARGIDWNAWEHRLAGIRIPVTIMQAEEDRIFSMKSAQYLQKLIPTAELVSVEKCGHAMVFDQHRRVAEMILKCVDQVKGANESVTQNIQKSKA